MVTDDFWERMDRLATRAVASADRSYAAARDELETLMAALGLPEPERERLRSAATQERLYHPRLVAELLLTERGEAS